MSSKCKCEHCGRPVDCGETVCAYCENRIENNCQNGHCDIRLEEVKPGVFKFRREDGTYYLKRVCR